MTTTELVTLVPVFMTAIICPSICLMGYYMYKIRLQFDQKFEKKKKKKNDD